MRGVILAAGVGSRLYPLTKGIAKPLLPVYDKPIIYYSIALLMQMGIKDIMIIIAPKDVEVFKTAIGNGSEYGINISYGVQEVPLGIADAFRVSKDFIKDHKNVLLLGDNIFMGKNLQEKIKQAISNYEEGYTTIFGYQVPNPEAFGVFELDENDNIIGLEEKPLKPKSDIVSTGLYFYNEDVLDKFSKLKPSIRGEYEVLDINNMYLEEGRLKGIKLEKDLFSWIDTGSVDSLIYANNLVRELTEKKNDYDCYPEVIALKNKWISVEQYSAICDKYKKSLYGQNLKKYLEEYYEKDC